MKKFIFLFVFYNILFAKTLVLDAHKDLSYKDLFFVAHGGQIELSEQSMLNIEAGYNVLINAVLQGKSVYGLSVGVGWNKDKPVFDINNGTRVLNDELLHLSKRFNRDSLRAHALGYGEYLDPDVVRMAMLIRLKTSLSGEAGISVELAKMYVRFLNLGITPAVPAKGSVGEADITLAAHIGLAMMGEHKVFYQNQILPSLHVLKMLNIKPLEPVAKDFLSILSNNALTNARLVFHIFEAQNLLEQQYSIYILMLEALNGNIAPLSILALDSRGFMHVKQSAMKLNACLEGSYLNQIHPHRALQDPLSFRTQVYALAEVNKALQELKDVVIAAINHSDDNPVVFINAQKTQNEVLDSYFISEKEAIVPTANFEFYPISLNIEVLNLSLARLSENITQSLLRLSNPTFTSLPRFLMHAENKGHGFGAIEKPMLYLNEDIKNLSLPMSTKSAVLAGEIEDVATFSNMSTSNLGHILINLRYLLSFELMYATQAIDLRKEKEDLALSRCSLEFYNVYRKDVPFFKQDRIYTDELHNGYQILKNMMSFE